MTGGAPDPAEAERAGPSCTVPSCSNPRKEPRPEDICRRRDESRNAVSVTKGAPDETEASRAGPGVETQVPAGPPNVCAGEKYAQGRERRGEDGAPIYVEARATPLWRRPAFPRKCS